ncbi:hypothetical protein SOVF_026810, partial [Spinacia oleracea]
PRRAFPRSHLLSHTPRSSPAPPRLLLPHPVLSRRRSSSGTGLNKEKKLLRPPTPSEVYYKGHAKENGEFVDETSRKLWADFQSKKSTNLEDENPKTENELFLEALCGWKSGRVYGLGNAVDNFYVKPNNDLSLKKVRNELVTSLTSNVEQLSSKNLEQAKEIEETKVVLVETTTKLNETEKKLDDTTRQLKETTDALKAMQAQILFLTENAILRQS